MNASPVDPELAAEVARLAAVHGDEGPSPPGSALVPSPDPRISPRTKGSLPVALWLLGIGAGVLFLSAVVSRPVAFDDFRDESGLDPEEDLDGDRATRVRVLGDSPRKRKKKVSRSRSAAVPKPVG